MSNAWWKSNAGWNRVLANAARTDREQRQPGRRVGNVPTATLNRHYKAQRAQGAERTEAIRVATSKVYYPKRKALREQGVIADQYTPSLLRQHKVCEQPSLLDYEPIIGVWMDQADIDFLATGEENTLTLSEIEQTITDLLFDGDTTIGEGPDEFDSEAHEEREGYLAALEDVAHGDYDEVLEHFENGRRSHTTLKLALEGGWVSVPEYTDAFDSPAMTADVNGTGMLSSILAEHVTARKSLRKVTSEERPAQARLLRLLNMAGERRRHAQLLQLDPVLAEQVAGRERVPVHPVLSCTNSVQELRRAWLAAREAQDSEALPIIERLGKLAALAA